MLSQISSERKLIFKLSQKRIQLSHCEALLEIFFLEEKLYACVWSTRCLEVKTKKKRNRLMLWVKSMKKREEDRGRFQNGFSLLSLTCMSGTRDISLLEAMKNEKHY